MKRLRVPKNLATHNLPLPAHHQARGQVAEGLFIAIITALGFKVSRPFTENCPYDFILDWHGRLLRVQLKSAWTTHNGSYIASCSLHKNHNPNRPYTTNEIDFLVVYVADGEDRPTLLTGSWYVLPPSVFAGRSTLSIPRKTKRRMLRKYQDAWHLLQPEIGKAVLA